MRDRRREREIMAKWQRQRRKHTEIEHELYGGKLLGEYKSCVVL